MRSSSAIAAAWPTSGSEPEPRPRVICPPMCSVTSAALCCSDCRSVLTAMNSTPATPASIMRLTALTPPRRRRPPAARAGARRPWPRFWLVAGTVLPLRPVARALKHVRGMSARRPRSGAPWGWGSGSRRNRAAVRGLFALGLARTLLGLLLGRGLALLSGASTSVRLKSCEQRTLEQACSLPPAFATLQANGRRRPGKAGRGPCPAAARGASPRAPAQRARRPRARLRRARIPSPKERLSAAFAQDIPHDVMERPGERRARYRPRDEPQISRAAVHQPVLRVVGVGGGA